MRKNRATRLANKVGTITELRKLLVPLKAAAKKAEGRDKLPTRRKVETHEAAIVILQTRKAEKKSAGDMPKPSPADRKRSAVRKAALTKP